MFTGGGLRFHTAVVLLIQTVVVVVACVIFIQEFQVSPDVVGIGSEYFVVYFRVYIYVRPVYHYIAATVTVVYLAQRFITVCVVVI